MNTLQVMIVGGQEITAPPAKHQYYHVAYTAAPDAETAISLFQQRPFDIVFFGKDMDGLSQTKLSRLFRFQDEGVVVAGWNDADPESSLKEALQQRRQQRQSGYAFKDDALKNARFNIHIA